MSRQALYPLRFEPIFQYRLWGGRRLASLVSAALPDGPVGEAWLLSDRDDFASQVANGSLTGRTISQMMRAFPEQMMGNLAGRFPRFPLLLKFLDVREMLSVQVHPGYLLPGQLPKSEVAKTEAWVVLDAGKDSRVYAGLKPGVTPDSLRQSVSNDTLVDQLNCLVPRRGDGIFIPAGTVHALGCGVVVFEIQQNSDTTYRLYDWGHVDTKTGKPRALQVDQALACVNFGKSAAGLTKPVQQTVGLVDREKFFDCDAFELWRLRGDSPFQVGAAGLPRVLVCIDGGGTIEHEGATYAIGKGEAWLLPAIVGPCAFRPAGAVNLLEIALPESMQSKPIHAQQEFAELMAPESAGESE
jgi:mannose-6-phosphate isomerase